MSAAVATRSQQQQADSQSSLTTTTTAASARMGAQSPVDRKKNLPKVEGKLISALRRPMTSCRRSDQPIVVIALDLTST